MAVRFSRKGTRLHVLVSGRANQGRFARSCLTNNHDMPGLTSALSVSINSTSSAQWPERIMCKLACIRRIEMILLLGFKMPPKTVQFSASALDLSDQRKG